MQCTSPIAPLVGPLLLCLCAVAVLVLDHARASVEEAWAEVGAWRAHHIKTLRLQSEWFAAAWKAAHNTPPPLDTVTLYEVNRAAGTFDELIAADLRLSEVDR